MHAEAKGAAAVDIVKTTIRVPRTLWNEVLHRSIDDDINSQEIVERALREYLKKKKAAKK